jgi:hypothetical protein
MYCINCGVKLADSEQRCPLCGTVPYHPEITRPEGRPLYPKNRYPSAEISPKAVHVVILLLFLLPILTTLLIDLRINRCVTWSGYVVGALLLTYEMVALPMWFRKPNPVIFVPCGFAAVGLYLLYIDLHTGGGWFLSFAFPVVGGIGLIVTAVVTLLRYLRRGRLYIFGGAFMALGAFMLLMEFLIVITFGRNFVGWSIYPMAALILLGGFLIWLAIDHSTREMMERKLFI